MKKFGVLCVISLFVLLPVILVISCQQQPSPVPTPTPSPPPVPSPTPTPSPPSPPPTPEIPPEVKELLVLRINGWAETSTYWVEGTVKNVGTVPLNDVQLVVQFYDKDGTLVTTVRGPLEPKTIDVWKTAHCEVQTQEKVNLIKKYRYEFVLASGESVPARLE